MPGRRPSGDWCGDVRVPGGWCGDVRPPADWCDSVPAAGAGSAVEPGLAAILGILAGRRLKPRRGPAKPPR